MKYAEVTANSAGIDYSYDSYEPTHIYIADMLTKEVSKCTVTSERSVLVKIANSTVLPTLRGFRWYPYFRAQE